MIFYIFYILNNQNKNERLSLTTSNNINVSICFFFNIFSSSLDGGSIYVYKTDSISNLYFNTFINISGSLGGAVYTNCLKSFSNILCFQFCNGTRGSSILQVTSSNNELNQTTIINSFASSFATWDLWYGPSSIFSINVSKSISIQREVSGHFGGGPICKSKYYFVYKTSGPGIFGPYSEYSGEMIHEFCNFFNNSCTNLGIIVVWSGQHTILNSIFLKNIGILSSSGTDIYIGRGTLLYSSCKFDTSLSGYYNNHINCNFNLLQIELIDFPINLPFKCFNIYSNSKINFLKFIYLTQIVFSPK